MNFNVRTHLRIRSDLKCRKKPRNVSVIPVLPGFVDQTRGLAGSFNAAFYADEELPVSASEQRRLVLGKTAIADFVMVPAGE